MTAHPTPRDPRWPRRRNRTASRALACAVAVAALLAAAGPALAEGGSRAVTSLLEMRREQVVVQEWDLSCGAAALTTILNNQFQDPVSEREVALGLMGRAAYVKNPDLVNRRFGFSLLDLKRYADGRGYLGVGYGGMNLDDLVERAPVIVPVRLNGYNHFVVFRGLYRDRVLLADPAWGNRTLPRGKFVDAWIDYGNLGHVGFLVKHADGSRPPNRMPARPSDFTFLR